MAGSLRPNLHPQRKHDVILIADDGSPASQSAIDGAGDLLSVEPATVLTVLTVPFTLEVG
jgi:hypothetical protein